MLLNSVVWTDGMLNHCQTSWKIQPKFCLVLSIFNFYHPKCLAMVEQPTKQDHRIHFNNMMVLAKLPQFSIRIICEATEISLPCNFSRERGYQPSPAWMPIIHILLKQRGCLNVIQPTGVTSVPDTSNLTLLV
jgi:hypothetical protein